MKAVTNKNANCCTTQNSSVAQCCSKSSKLVVGCHD
ncbi:hypothetical protein EDC21_101126 [Thermohydrogenium kirishiense]|nr:hypothetical protein [Thermoanaerobacterium thermosaccharolyticum]TCW42512.1 hypothetical protein EDC21_101126 [Thermohydrogenium kirishiense]